MTSFVIVQVTFIEALPRMMPGFDRQIASLADRLLIRPRSIDHYTNVFASKVTPGERGVKPCVVEMIDATTKERPLLLLLLVVVVVVVVVVSLQRYDSISPSRRRCRAFRSCVAH